MIRHPQKSTLFRYTTLFRSIIYIGYDYSNRRFGEIRKRLGLGENDSMPDSEVPEALKLQHALFTSMGAAAVIDRKSTRLNSSHTVISYAVFCLKKKK